jgi:hypothetical protein
MLWPDPAMAAIVRARNVPRAGGEGAFAIWEHQSFLWTNEGYGDFAGYLAAFSKNMRRNVLREREGLDAAGIRRRIIRAGEASTSPLLLERMADFYESTNDKFGPWAARFLERDFFRRLPEFLPEGWLLGAAFNAAKGESSREDPIGLSFIVEGDRGLWGRYWGAARFEAGLHFELCYYLPTAYALEKGLTFFDPGMGSEHKARRGFRSVLVPSFHHLFDPRLARALHRSLPAANRHEAAGARSLDEDLPFKARPTGPQGVAT